MLWKILLFFADLAMLQLNLRRSQLKDSWTKSAHAIAQRVLLAMACASLALIGITTFIIDLIVASNLRGGGALKLSQASGIAVASCLFGMYGFVAYSKKAAPASQPSANESSVAAALELLQGIKTILSKIDDDFSKREKPTKNEGSRPSRATENNFDFQNES